MYDRCVYIPFYLVYTGSDSVTHSEGVVTSLYIVVFFKNTSLPVNSVTAILNILAQLVIH